jgi:hypothetical protein
MRLAPPMTGSELRAQLRAQQARNSGATLDVECETAELRADKARRWRITFPKLAPVEVLFTPEATKEEVLAACFGAVEAVSLPDPTTRAATPAEAAELHKFVNAVLADASENDRAEAFAIALADPEAALEYFRYHHCRINHIANANGG